MYSHQKKDFINNLVPAFISRKRTIFSTLLPFCGDAGVAKTVQEVKPERWLYGTGLGHPGGRHLLA
ncbi:hypothetical protein CMO92_03220 [Candidatus Woesearchaeota archaeon]|nr:hypothetical protein [Candidatus Woesearchaeota archaeon]|tara:strand:- start:795 stop:992 length:198 start_codon:yes stop_codon:yes gene_type:complete